MGALRKGIRVPESHHYIPKMYLRNFVDPETPANYEPYLGVYSLDRRHWKKKAPKNVATGQDFYAFVDEDGRIRQDFERQALSLVEGLTASIIDKTIFNLQFLEETDRCILAEFISLMMCRVPIFRDRMENLLQTSV